MMRKKYFLYLICVYFGVLHLCGVIHTFAVQESETVTAVSLSSYVDVKHVPLNRTLIFTVQLAWSGDIDLIEIGEIEEPILTNFDIVGTSSANRVTGTADTRKSVKEITYALQPQNLGMCYIESTGLSYEDLRTGKTHYLKTQRIGVEAVGAVADPGERSYLFIWIAAGVVLAIGFFVFIVIRKYRSLAAEETEVVAPIIEETFLTELKEKVNLKEGDRGEALSMLTKLFRTYLKEKYGISALEATTAELVHLLKEEGLDEGLVTRCETLFQKADVVKFSGQDASQAELDEAYTTVETILESHLLKSREQIQKMEEEHEKKQKKWGKLLKKK